jgi:predicted RNA-binding Zn-ribbon protein involved in translation (DUF1610 family)
MQKHVDWLKDIDVLSTGQNVPCNTNGSLNSSTAYRCPSCGNLKINWKIQIFAIKTYGKRTNCLVARQKAGTVV